MRKLLLALCLVMSMVLSLTACGGSKRVWIDRYGYECAIDYENGIFSIYKNQEELAEIPFTVTVNGNNYHCEVTFPDGTSYWEKQKLQNGMNTIIMPKVGEDYGYSDGYVEVKQLIKGDYIVDEIVENYEKAEEQTVSFPIGRIFLAIVVGLIGLLQVCAPEAMWFLNRGWRFKNAEPSEAGLAASRISGAFVMVLAVIILFTSCAG